MNERDYLAERFEEHRTHPRAVAYRMLGSVSEVDDAVQEAWLRLSRTERQLASRARRRVRGGAAMRAPDLVRQRDVVEAFLAALRRRRRRSSRGARSGSRGSHGPGSARRAGRGPRRGGLGEGAVAYGHMARLVRPALVNGAVGLVTAPRGRLVRALTFTIANGKIVEIEVIGDSARLAELDVSIVD